MTRKQSGGRIRIQTRGVTLMELLVVMFIVGLTSFVIVNISIKANKLFARSSVRIEPQASTMLAFKRMEREIRQAMLISTTTPSSSTWIDVQLPQKDDQGLNQLSVDEDGRIQLTPGIFVHYFLGSKVQVRDAQKHLYLASPSETGTTLFRAESTYDVENNTFDNARDVIDDIVNPSDPAVLSDPEVNRAALASTLFSYTPYNDNGTPDDYSDDRPLTNTNLITIALIVKSTLQGRPIYHPLQTKFCLRNLKY